MKLLRATIALALLLPLVAQAGLVRYNFDGASGDGWDMLAYVELDESDLVDGINLVPFFTSWAMSWTDGTTDITTDSSLEGLDVFSYFEVDSSLDVLVSDLCSGFCDGVDHPEALIGTFEWIATLSATECCVEGIGVWSGPTAVPEPGTLGLLGLGLVGFAFARRKHPV